MQSRDRDPKFQSEEEELDVAKHRGLWVKSSDDLRTKTSDQTWTVSSDWNLGSLAFAFAIVPVLKIETVRTSLRSRQICPPRLWAEAAHLTGPLPSCSTPESRKFIFAIFIERYISPISFRLKMHVNYFTIAEIWIWLWGSSPWCLIDKISRKN